MTLKNTLNIGSFFKMSIIRQFNFHFHFIRIVNLPAAASFFKKSIHFHQFDNRFIVKNRHFYYSTKSRVDIQHFRANMSQKDGRLSKLDPNSFSNSEDVHADKIHLNWNVDFDKKIINGSVTYELVLVNPDVKQMIFDTKDLTISEIKDVKTGEKLKFEFGENAKVASFGKPLKVDLPKDRKEKPKIQIDYETSPSASALQWLNKEQTHEKKFPYMFSQCQAIHARTLLPCQDTPSTKVAFTADVTAPKELVVLMSGIRSEPKSSNDKSNVTKFEQTVPIPSYLIAIVVGNLQSIKIGPRSKVWSEQEFLKTAAIDFSETEDMIKAAESIVGMEYIWGIYDILVLPPSFPFGGMENPCLTFATPTILAGDKSLASVIAHEIAHSWTGNLVTNSSFEHFWLNEGFTVFLERKIIGRIRGEKNRQFESIGGWKNLTFHIKDTGNEDPLTCLVPNLTDISPDDSFSVVPYEKGYAFLYYLEEKVGGSSVFELFLQNYIKDNKFKSFDTNFFQEYIVNYFTKLGKPELMKDVDWKAWLHTPGMPPYQPKYDTSLADQCIALKNRWLEWDASKPCPFKKTDIEKLTPNQMIEFLNEILLDERPWTADKAKAMQTAYDLNSVKNCEIRYSWVRLGIKGKWLDILPLALDFVTVQGRMKYIRPVYRDLFKWEEVRQKAIENFQKNKNEMMYVSAYTVAKDLQLPL